MVRITNRNRETVSQSIVDSNNITVNDQHTHVRVLTNACNALRKKYLEKLSNIRERNVIAYYSAFLQRTGDSEVLSINDQDKNGLMSVIHTLETDRGLDIILHTPGGDIAATESFIDYLYQKFDTDITAIVPQIAMSGGTLIACACKEIFMGKHSNIGPIDPQIGGLPAGAILDEFEYIVLDGSKETPEAIPIFQKLVEKYHPGFLVQCRNAITLSESIAREILKKNMLKNKSDEEIKKIVDSLNDHFKTKTHSRHIHFHQAKNIGLVIQDIENNQDLQDTILSIHHLYMHTFQQTQASKIIENQVGNSVIISTS